MRTLILAGGSPSTLLAVACFCSGSRITPAQIRSGEVKIVFTQAFQVGVDPRSGKASEALQAVRELPQDGKVVLIGLPVNNREPEMTLNLFREIGSDRFTAVLDEHEPERWAALRTELGWDESGKGSRWSTPGKGGEFLSAASIVYEAFAWQGMPYQWVEAGDYADNRQHSVSPEAHELATQVDNACKARIGDNAFRVTCVLHLLGEETATKAFEDRLAEGRAIEEATTASLEAAELRGNILVVRQSDGVEINQTAAMFAGYRRAPFVAIVGQKSGEAATTVVVVGCNDRHPSLGKTNLLEALAPIGKPSGIPAKATLYGGEDTLSAVVETLNGLQPATPAVGN